MEQNDTARATIEAMSHNQLAFSVDCVIFGYGEEGLKILLVECKLPPYVGTWSLLGDFVRREEDLDTSVQRAFLRGTFRRIICHYPQAGTSCPVC